VITAKDEEIKSLKQLNQSLQTDAAANQTLISSLKEEIVAKSDEKRKVEEDIAALRSQLAKQSDDLQKKEKETTQLKVEISHKSESQALSELSLKKEIDDLKRQQEEMSRKNESLTKKNEEAGKKIEELSRPKSPSPAVTRSPPTPNTPPRGDVTADVDSLEQREQALLEKEMFLEKEKEKLFALELKLQSVAEEIEEKHQSIESDRGFLEKEKERIQEVFLCWYLCIELILAHFVGGIS
jgi:hypothetical protein